MATRVAPAACYALNAPSRNVESPFASNCNFYSGVNHGTWRKATAGIQTGDAAVHDDGDATGHVDIVPDGNNRPAGVPAAFPSCGGQAVTQIVRYTHEERYQGRRSAGRGARGAVGGYR